MKIILLTIYFFLFAACTEKNIDSKQLSNSNSNAIYFLSKTDNPKVTLIEIDEFYFLLKLQNKEKVIDIKLENNPGEGYKFSENFFTNLCGKEVFVIVLKNSNSKGDSYGSFYTNIVINPESGDLMKIFEGGEFKDKETNKIISDKQKQIITMLKSQLKAEQDCKQ